MTEFDKFVALISKGSREESNPSKLQVLLEGPEMNKNYTIHVSYIVKAFIDGICDSQPLTNEMKFPTRIDAVSNWIMYMAHKQAKGFVIESTIKNIVEQTKGWVNDHPEIRKWEVNMDAVFANMATNLLSHISAFEKLKKDVKDYRIKHGKDKGILP